MLSRDELHEVAQKVYDEFKMASGYGNHAAIAVIGGLALWKLEEDKPTEILELLVLGSDDSTPAGVMRSLLTIEEHDYTDNDNPFLQQDGLFYYVTDDDVHVQIEFTMGWQAPYYLLDLPSLHHNTSDIVPYVPTVDLIALYMHMCGCRTDRARMERDARLAEALLEHAAAHAPVQPTPEQDAVFMREIENVLPYSAHREDWWREKLGLPEKEPVYKPVWNAEECRWLYVLVEDAKE